MEAHGAYSLFVSQSKMADAGDGKSVIAFKDCEIVRAFKVKRVDGLNVVQIPDRSEVGPIPATLEPSLKCNG